LDQFFPFTEVVFGFSDLIRSGCGRAGEADHGLDLRLEAGVEALAEPP